MFGLDGNIQWKPALFICSFIVLNVWVVLQISVAVLLDNFVTVAMKVESDEKKRMVHEKRAASQFKNPLEPLIAKLAYEYTDSADLSSKLIALFQVGTADCLQFQLLPQRAIDSSDSTVQQ
jgi:hypothetical protein